MRIDEIEEALLRMAGTAEGSGAVADLACALLLACRQSQKPASLFERCQAHGLHVLPVHYYSPIPDTRELPERLWTTASPIPSSRRAAGTSFRP